MNNQIKQLLNNQIVVSIMLLITIGGFYFALISNYTVLSIVLFIVGCILIYMSIEKKDNESMRLSLLNFLLIISICATVYGVIIGNIYVFIFPFIITLFLVRATMQISQNINNSDKVKEKNNHEMFKLMVLISLLFFFNGEFILGLGVFLTGTLFEVVRINYNNRG